MGSGNETTNHGIHARAHRELGGGGGGGGGGGSPARLHRALALLSNTVAEHYREMGRLFLIFCCALITCDKFE